MLAITLPDASLGKPDDMIGTAMRATHNAIGPAQLNHERLAVFEILEVNDGFLKCAWRVHESSMPEIVW
jgi:hypothetical protein